MFEFRRQNRNKIAQCAIDRITPEMEDQYAEMGDASPLYRSVDTVRFLPTTSHLADVDTMYILDTPFEKV